MNPQQQPDDQRLSALYQKRKAQHSQTTAQKTELKQQLHQKLAQQTQMPKTSLWRQPQLWGSTVAAAMLCIVVFNYWPNLDNELAPSQDMQIEKLMAEESYSTRQLHDVQLKRSEPPIEPLQIVQTPMASSYEQYTSEKIDTTAIEVAVEVEPEQFKVSSAPIEVIAERSINTSEQIRARGASNFSADMVQAKPNQKAIEQQLQIVQRKENQLTAQNCTQQQFQIDLERLKMDKIPYKSGDWIKVQINSRSGKVMRISKPLNTNIDCAP